MKKFKKKFAFAGLFILLIALPLFAIDRIEVGDTLIIHAVDDQQTDLVLGTVVQQADYTGRDPHEFQVSNSGAIFLLNIGPVKVAGLTIEELENSLIEKMKIYGDDVRISVLLKTIKTNAVYVLGAVNDPGLYEIPRHDPIRNRLMNAIKLAGGFSEQADQRQLEIVRRDKIVFTADLHKLMNSSDLSNNYPLENGDTVIVKVSFPKVYVLGQVIKPGGIPFVPEARFMEYISEAGGFNDAADYNNIGIVHQENGKTIVRKIGIDLLQSPDLLQSTPLAQGDIIYVPKQFFANWKDLGSILGIARDSIYIYESIK